MIDEEWNEKLLEAPLVSASVNSDVIGKVLIWMLCHIWWRDGCQSMVSILKKLLIWKSHMVGQRQVSLWSRNFATLHTGMTLMTTFVTLSTGGIFGIRTLSRAWNNFLWISVSITLDVNVWRFVFFLISLRRRNWCSRFFLWRNQVRCRRLLRRQGTIFGVMPFLTTVVTDWFRSKRIV